MRPVKLEEIIPQPATFYLSATPDRAYHLRPVDLDDEVWLQERFGDRLQDVLATIKIREVSEIVFHQLETEDQKFFSAKDVTIINDQTGEESTQRLGGAPFLRKLIRGKKELYEVYRALMQTLGISRPMMDEIEKSSEKKSEVISQPTGDLSSTPSPASTDGPSEKSENLP